jgi:phosphoribosylformylglycinamidine synthase
MSTYRVDVRITPREGLLDPEGKAVEHALQALDFDGVSGVAMGRLIRFRLEAADPADAERKAEEMCRKLLANPVTEDYTIGIEEA